MITPKQRLINVLAGINVDRPPCICPGGMMNMIVKDIMDVSHVYWPEAHYNAKMMADLTSAMVESGGFENYGLPFCMTVEAEAMGAKVNMGTKINEPHVSEYAIASCGEWEKIPQIDVGVKRAKVLCDAIKILSMMQDGIPIVANLTGPISVASSLVDPSVYYREMRKKPDKMHEFMDFVADQIIELGKAEIDAGADIIAISDPSATGEILGPKMFDEYAIKYINKILCVLKEYGGKATIVHICGQLKPVYSYLQELKSNAISFDSIVDIKQVKDNIKEKAIMGNVSTYAIEYGKADTVKSLAKKCVRDGADIVAPACGLGVNSPFINIKTMVETVAICKR